MSHASLRRLRVALYTYTSEMDAATGITASAYVRALSPDADGLWWASRGTVFGGERSPTPNPQEEQTSFWSFSAYAPVTADGVMALGTVSDTTFTPQSVYRVQSVMERNYWRDTVQVYATLVDDANATVTLTEPD